MTLESIGQQHYPHLEIAVVDDGSEIPIQTVIDRWYKTARRPGLSIKTKRQANRGPAAARNAGIEISQGELVLFMDDDDFIAPDAVGHLVKAINNILVPKVAMGSYRLQYDSQGGGYTGKAIAPPHLDAKERLSSMIAGGWFVPIHGYLFTRAAIRRIGPWNSSLSSQEDDELLLRAALVGVPFSRAPKAMTYYRQHDGTRRATPGKPNESQRQGRLNRLYCDMKIRKYAYRELRRLGGLEAHRAAFLSWQRRLAERYGDLFESSGMKMKSNALLNWLAHPSYSSQILSQPQRTRPAWLQKPLVAQSHVKPIFSSRSKTIAMTKDVRFKQVSGSPRKDSQGGYNATRPMRATARKNVQDNERGPGTNHPARTLGRQASYPSDPISRESTQTAGDPDRYRPKPP